MIKLQLTEWQSCSNWFQEAHWLALSNRILGKHLHQVFLAFVQLAHFELKCVAVGVARGCEGASLRVGLLDNVASDGRVAVTLRGLPSHTDVVLVDLNNLEVLWG